MTKGVGWKAVNPQHPPSTYTHRYETTQREVRKRWCGGLWKVIRTVSNFLTFHLAGGKLGMKHTLEQFGPTLKKPWTKLKAPNLTKKLSNKIIRETKKQSIGALQTDKQYLCWVYLNFQF